MNGVKSLWASLQGDTVCIELWAQRHTRDH